jgi:hypothetical protein
VHCRVMQTKDVFQKHRVPQFREFVYQVVVHRRVVRVVVSMQRLPRQRRSPRFLPVQGASGSASGDSATACSGAPRYCSSTYCKVCDR